MKTRKIVLSCLLGLIVFLVTGAAVSAIRIKYRSLPEARGILAYFYSSFVSEYAFLQYNQAGGEQGRKALLDYLQVIQEIRERKMQTRQDRLHYEYGLTCLRLYRLEMAANKPAEAENYLRSAQQELSSAGLKDVSAEQLIKSMETREAGEAKLYNSSGLSVPVATNKPNGSLRGNSQ